MQYFYPQVQGGYRWNMLQRIINTIGIEPINSGDMEMNGSMVTFIEFSAPLTEANKTLLDGIMATNPTFPPPTTNSVYQIKDIWETRQEFSTKVGNLPFKIYYNESVPGSGNIDRIEMHFAKTLGSAEKNKVVDEFSKLMILKQA